MANVEFHPEAKAEYVQAYKWYEERSLRAAVRFESEVENALTRVVATPESFPRYDAIHRFAIVHRFPYGVVYRTIADDIKIVAIAHASRSPDYWQDRR